jgi:carbonic anhydrase
VLSCSDARVPVEMIFRQACNDLFVVRLAGNVVTDEGVGSLGYAVEHLDDNVKLIVALGHSCCGAVTAAVDAYLGNATFGTSASEVGLKAIVERILASVRTATQALERNGITKLSAENEYRQRLVETSIVLNAAMTAMTLQQAMSTVPSSGYQVVYGVYDLASRLVQAPKLASGGQVRIEPHLADPPNSVGEFENLADQLVRSREV